jgi:hypothetical protein
VPQSEILACLNWIGEFQILACIPLDGSVPVKDVAELSNVPEAQLARIIRLVATAAFLEEPEDGHVAHTALSTRFLRDPSLLDAAMFLAEAAVPTALQMVPATLHYGNAEGNGPSHAWSLASNSTATFHAAREERPRLRRQWLAYLRHAGGLLTTDESNQVLAQLHWSNINAHANDGSSSPCIVEVGVDADSVRSCLAVTLLNLYPDLRFLVQVASAHSPDLAGSAFGLGPRIAVNTRTPGARQLITDAAVYVLHLSDPHPEADILCELQAHLGPLRIGNGVMIILTSRLLPEPGSLADPEVEAVARSRDLTMRQLLNYGEMEMTDLLGKISMVRDSMGQLVVAKELRSPSNIVVALVVRYQPDMDH